MSFVALTALLACGLATPAAAQESSTTSYARELSLTYSFLHDYGQNGTMGMQLDFGRQLKGRTSIIGEFAVNHFSGWEETYTSYGGGLRFGGMSRSKVRPYVQLVVGAQHDFGSTGFNIQPGVGLNMKLSRKIDTKIQVDFPIVQWEGESYKQFRLNIGVGLPLGSR